MSAEGMCKQILAGQHLMTVFHLCSIHQFYSEHRVRRRKEFLSGKAVSKRKDDEI